MNKIKLLYKIHSKCLATVIASVLNYWYSSSLFVYHEQKEKNNEK